MRWSSIVSGVYKVSCGLLLLYLVVTRPRYQEKPCPPLTSHINCGAVMSGDTTVIHSASQYPWCIRDDEVSDYAFVQLCSDCDKYQRERGYGSLTPPSMEETDFPLAFSILMYENVDQFERLLKAIYQPQNVYCVHVDPKASYYTRKAVQAISKCHHNVIIASKLVDIHWGEYTLLEAELVCVRDLWNNKVQWKYYINLTGREYPLKTNKELVQILKSYGGANDIDGTLHKRPILWTRYVWRNENWRTSVEKPPVPHGFLIAKGSTHVAASRAFIDYALNDPRAQDLLEWMQDIRAPDEHFFPTLNHNPHLGVPGAYKGDPDLKWFYTRLKIWWNEKNTEPCAGQWVRYICNLGVGDLHRLPGAKQLFVNKIRLEQDPVAFHCLEQWHLNKTKGLITSDVNLSFYRGLDFVKNHS